MFNKKVFLIQIFLLVLPIFFLPSYTLAIDSAGANLKQYYINEVFDTEQKAILGYQPYSWSSGSQSFSRYADVSRRQYLVKYGNGCLNLKQYKDQYVDVDVGADNSLDGVSDKINLLGGGECNVLNFVDITSVYDTISSRVVSGSLDINSPQPPRSCLLYSDGLKINWLSSNLEYVYQRPSFEWFGGVDDVGVAGYYVLLSKDLNADPFLLGTFQEGNSFVAPVISDDGTYYLKIITKDISGNLSSGVYCTYKHRASTDQLSSGELFKGTGSTIYYFGADGKKYIFPNQTTYFSWYNSFSGIKNITDSVLASISLGGNITIKPGAKLVQFVSMDTPWKVVDPRVWAVGENGVLHWIKSAELAAALYGSDWENKIVALPEVFMTNYTIGTEIDSATDYDPTEVSVASPNININKNLIL